MDTLLWVALFIGGVFVFLFYRGLVSTTGICAKCGKPVRPYHAMIYYEGGVIEHEECKDEADKLRKEALQ